MPITEKDFGETATCGITNKRVIISEYNLNCPCLNCVSCKDKEDASAGCQYRYMLETKPCTDDAIYDSYCKKCIEYTNKYQYQY